MSTQVQLGDTVKVKDKMARVVRILHSDHSLFEDDTGTFIIHESYAQLKFEDGAVDFLVYSSEKLPYAGPPSPIKALNPIVWRRT